QRLFGSFGSQNVAVQLGRTNYKAAPLHDRVAEDFVVVRTTAADVKPADTGRGVAARISPAYSTLRSPGARRTASMTVPQTSDARCGFWRRRSVYFFSFCVRG